MAIVERAAVRRVPLGNLRLRSRILADGIYAGSHRSTRRGAGVEFAGFREYSLGDDLRRVDWRAYFRFDRLLSREFDTETERTVEFVVDASRSMAYRSTPEDTKYGYAALLACGLARVAISAGDPVGLSLLGGDGDAVRGGRSLEAVERMVALLESEGASADVASDERAVERSLEALFYRPKRGALCFFFSDLLDLPEPSLDLVARLATFGRRVVVVQVLDPDEARFPFREAMLLRSMEGKVERQISGEDDAARYARALESLVERWRTRLEGRNGALVTAETSEAPLEVARRILRAVR